LSLNVGTTSGSPSLPARVQRRRCAVFGTIYIHFIVDKFPIWIIVTQWPEAGKPDVDRSIKFANGFPPRIAQSRLQRRLAGFSPQENEHDSDTTVRLFFACY
jgi:hypothetical protein